MKLTKKEKDFIINDLECQFNDWLDNDWKYKVDIAKNIINKLKK